MIIQTKKAFSGTTEIMEVIDRGWYRESVETLKPRGWSETQTSLYVVEKSAATSPVEKLPPEKDRAPCVGPSSPERVLTLITPAKSPNSAGIPPVRTSTVRNVRASRLVEKIADMLSVTGIPSTTYCTCHSEPRGCMRPLSSVTKPGAEATMLSIAREGDAPLGRSKID